MKIDKLVHKLFSRFVYPYQSVSSFSHDRKNKLFVTDNLENKDIQVEDKDIQNNSEESIKDIYKLDRNRNKHILKMILRYLVLFCLSSCLRFVLSE